MMLNPDIPHTVDSGRLPDAPCSAFVLDRMPWEKEWTIRIVMPGIDGLHAVWLETTCVRETRVEVEALLDRIMDGLKGGPASTKPQDD